jgi:nucleotide-binding universal stress UspA family protein
VQPFRRILLALARAETDSGLLDYAAMLARVMGETDLLCVHVLPEDGEAAPDAFEAEVLAHLKDVPRATKVVCHLRRGDRTDALLEFAAAEAVDLILLGHRRDRSGRRSLARRLAMKAPCSVWMAPENSPARFNRILVAIDFSERAADALSVATALAEAAGLDECLALHVHFSESTLSFEDYEEMVEEEQDQAFCLFIAPIDLHGVYVKPLFVEGPNVPQTILRVAAEQQADLIVMGTRGRSRSAAVLLGSETEQAMIETTVPILAVKHFGARRRLLEVLLDRRVRSRSERFF